MSIITVITSGVLATTTLADADSGTTLWPIALYFISLVVLLALMLFLAKNLGPKTDRRHTHTPYESGIVAADAPNSRFTSHFFLYAIFFVIFDLETIFLFAWVIAFDEVGLAGFIEASIFIFILLAALIYVWRIGALELKHKHKPVKLPNESIKQSGEL
ncbi:NADH-quinone oxidoreductase subunit A [Thalassotalea sp. HSM 43]|uniref:NADH-quinone oxidoreductase subunit A n=1 Tax=Thalassotalea sp. HSM 43 TaxID=2552945 RepID=UPI0010822750|nr:NADH-quinone oxidoreductase subunit A [Thalassotalea sp. HSM 43]QBY05505.1 NADH-quinone oxidoreductase subunit A [Thalassotalea sp. HSM 43]